MNTILFEFKIMKSSTERVAQKQMRLKAETKLLYYPSSIEGHLVLYTLGCNLVFSICFSR